MPTPRRPVLTASLLLISLVTLLAGAPVVAAPPAGDADPGPTPAPPETGVGDATKPPAEASTPKEMTPPIMKKNLSHRLQVSVDFAVGLGAAFLVTYEDTTWCGQGDPGPDNDSFCTGMAPVYLDFGLGFSVLDSLEIVTDFRLGVTRDMVGNRPLMLMPGLRLWIDPKLPFKIGIAFQMVIDFTKLEQSTNLPPKGQKLDLGARFYTQFQFDFLRYIGLFGRIGLVGTFQKWIGLNLEAQIGVQARFP